MDDLVERLEAGVTSLGLHYDNETELYDIADADEIMAAAAAEIRSLRAQVEQERAGRMTAIENARYRVCKRIAESRAGSYLIAGYLRGELDDSAAIQEALMAIERHEDKEPRA